MNMEKLRRHGWLRRLLVVTVVPLAGCVSVVSNLSAGFTEGLGKAILDNPDLQMVQDGAPAYLLLMDGLLAQNPDNAGLLLQSSRLKSAYTAAFVSDPERARLLAGQAFRDAERAVCVSLKNACGLRNRNYAEYEVWLERRKASELDLLYQLGGSWAGWIQANGDDFAAIAELGRVKALMQRIAEIDETYDHGGPHLYLGVFETLLPPAMGGRPEVGRRHFETAIEISHGEFLMTKVMFADQYARLVFDRDLHDELLKEVLAADPAGPGLTLINTVAQRRAKQLLDSADDYF